MVKHRRHKLVRAIMTITAAVGVVIGIFAISDAGTLAPDVSPVATFDSNSDVYDAIASSGYDSSSITADANGSAFQVAKCIISRIAGGSCP